jgi:hypothetical protein
MSKTKRNRFQDEYADELESLARILGSKDFVTDTKPLVDAAGSCRGSGANQWGYTLSPLVFRLKAGMKSIPHKVVNLTLTLSLDCKGVWSDGDVAVDPFTYFELQLLIRGEALFGKEGRSPVLSAWHLDREKYAKSPTAPRYIHPQYHLQYGGWDLRRTLNCFDSRNALILDSPRLAHPPMDGILAVDFVLTNFYDRTDLSFREEREYSDLLSAAVRRVWRPYAQALADMWPPSSACNWSGKTLWPQMGIL